MILLKPDPSELDAPLRSERDIARHRRLYCTHYDACLNLSIANCWQSFSCLHCPLADLAEKEPRPGSFAEERRPDHWR